METYLKRGMVEAKEKKVGAGCGSFVKGTKKRGGKICTEITSSLRRLSHRESVN